MGKKVRSRGFEEVEFKKSLFRFSMVFSLVLALGLVTRYALSTLPLEQLIAKRIKISDSYEINIHKPEIRLHQGLFPVLGVFFERIEIKEKRCSLKRLITNDVLLVINPFKLIAKDFKLNSVNIGFLEMNLPERCESTLEPDATTARAEPLPESKILQKATRELLQDNHMEDLFRETQKIIKSQDVSYVSVDSLEFRYLRAPNRELLFKGEFHGKVGDRILSELNIREVLLASEKLQIHPAEVNMVISEQAVDVDIKSSIREGHAKIKLNIANEKTYPVQLDLTVTKLPVSSVTHVFLPKYQFSYLWADCHVHLASPWAQVRQKSLQIDNCDIDGPYGSVIFKTVDASLSQLKSVQAEFSKIDLEQVIKNKRDLALAGTFANFGVLSQNLTYSEGAIAVDGFLENAELLFSNNSLRDVQKLKRIPFRFEGAGGKWNIGVDKIEIEEGEFDGNIQVQLEPQDTEAQGVITIHKLQLRPSIYKLMAKAKPALLQIYGKFALHGNKVKNWSAILVTPQLEAEGYQLQNLKVKGESIDSESSQVKISVASGSVQSKSDIVNWLKVTTLQNNWPENEEATKFQELSVRLLIEANKGVSWQRGYARMANGWQLSTEGHRDIKKNLNAWLQWDRPASEFLRWTYEGQFFAGVWYPANAWMHDWLSNNSDYLKEFKNVIGQELNDRNIGTKINDASKKAIEKVKSVLGNKVEE